MQSCSAVAQTSHGPKSERQIVISPSYHPRSSLSTTTSSSSSSLSSWSLLSSSFSSSLSSHLCLFNNQSAPTLHASEIRHARMYIADPIKVALGIGNCALRSYFWCLLEQIIVHNEFWMAKCSMTSCHWPMPKSILERVDCTQVTFQEVHGHIATNEIATPPTNSPPSNDSALIDVFTNLGLLT